MTWILLVVGVLHVVGIGWGLPASDAWDNDGVAPRDFLAGLVETVTPGHFTTYPPVHLLLLALLTLPITVVALARAPSLAAHDVIHEIIKVPYMTAIAYVARGVALVMSLGIVVFVARIAEELRAADLGLDASARDDHGRWRDPRVRRAGYAAAAFAGVNATATYYAHTSNLDVPYMFWALLALLAFVRAIARREPRLLRRAFVLAALAVGTKDQAYAMFALTVPAALVAWLALDPWARDNRARVLREAALGGAISAVVYAVLSGAIVNPAGFRARLAFLSGPATQDYVQYTQDWSGRMRVLSDAVRYFDRAYPVVLSPLILVGIALAFSRLRRAHEDERARRAVVAAVPLLAAASFTLAFNCVARRTDHRFLLPQSTALAVYGGLAVEWLVFLPRRPLRVAGQAFVSVAFAAALFACAAVDANLLGDPRYAAEAWLRERVRPGDTIEIYGHNVYLPRMPDGARVIRVGPEPLERRNPLPGVIEVREPFVNAEERGARFAVVSTGWVWRYLIDPAVEQGGGLAMPPTHARTVYDEDGRRYFQRLVRSEDAFQFVYEARFESDLFPPIEIHSSTARTIWIYERKPDRAR